MIVTPKGKPHNHDQGFSNFIRKEVNTELKRMALEFPKTKTNIIVDIVLQKNENFKKFYEQKSNIPLKKPMKNVLLSRIV